MVHALHEIWRVLQPGGCLIDLRPLHTSPPLEIVSGQEMLVAGQIDESGGVSKDTASNEALEQTVQAQWFRRERDAWFDFATYWDTPDALKAHAEERWNTTRLPEETLAEARRLTAASSVDTKVRIRYKMTISRLRKQTVP